jgi:hypothetical protein
MPILEVTYRGVTRVFVRLNGQAATVRFAMNPDLHPGEVRVSQRRSQLAPALTAKVVDGTDSGTQVLILEGTDSGAQGPHQRPSIEVTPANANWQDYKGSLPISPHRDPSTQTEIVVTVSRDGCQYVLA